MLTIGDSTSKVYGYSLLYSLKIFVVLKIFQKIKRLGGKPKAKTKVSKKQITTVMISFLIKFSPVTQEMRKMKAL